MQVEKESLAELEKRARFVGRGHDNPNSLIGLLWKLKCDRKKLDARMEAVRQRLRSAGVTDPLETTGDILELLNAVREKRSVVRHPARA